MLPRSVFLVELTAAQSDLTEIIQDLRLRAGFKAR